MKRLRSLTASLAVILLLTTGAQAQKLLGVVSHLNDQGVEEAVPGANVYWLGTSIAATTGDNGVFMIERSAQSNRLVISFIGLRSDTVTVTDQTSLRIQLQPEKML